MGQPYIVNGAHFESKAFRYVAAIALIDHTIIEVLFPCHLNICLSDLIFINDNADIFDQEMEDDDDDDEERMPNGDLSRDLRQDDDDLRDPVNVRNNQ